MSSKKIRNPLIKRIPRELRGDWHKYLVVSLFLILTIGFVSGMYVANGSMMRAAEEGAEKYKLENGHFELSERAEEKLISAIETGEMADVKQYYTDKAKKELDEKFDGEFKNEFDKEFSETFDKEFEQSFSEEFEKIYTEQVKAAISAQVEDTAMAEEMTNAAVEQAKQNGEYQAAYDNAYKESYPKAFETAYEEAYCEAYEKAYDEAWREILEEIDEEYAKAEDKYELNDADFKAVSVKVYENFFKNAEEDNNNDGASDGTVRVFQNTEEINLACFLEGKAPETEKEIAIDRMHADNAGIKTGDTVTISGEKFTVTGLLAYVNFSTLHEKNTDAIFDALKFDAAMMTSEGFDRIDENTHYSYGWIYDNKPSGEKDEKALSDNFLKALVTQAVCADNEINDFLPLYANQAVNFAADDMGGDEAMGGMLLNILIIIIAFIFAVTVSNTIVKESSAIGTLRASGYTKTELVSHYIAMPVIVTLLSAIVGNILGYTVFKNVVVSMYYNSYSLPDYVTVWNPEAFVRTTLIPIVIMIAVNLIVIIRTMTHTPLQFLRHDLKKTKRRKAMRLPRWKFMKRFRIRVILQNIPNYIILFAGVFFISVMLSMAVGMPDTLGYYQDNAQNMMFAKYQYILNSYEDEDENIITTENKDAERFGMYSLQYKRGEREEEISVYGISGGSRYVSNERLFSLKENEVLVSASYNEKYGISVGDEIVLDEKYDNTQYTFTVKGIYDKSLSVAVFMPIESFRTAFEQEKEEFTGYLSDTEITDIDKDDIAAVITEHDITKMCDQLDHSMGSYMQYFQILCILLSAVLIYLLSKIIIEKNETSISMTKILGYENREVAGLYLLSTAIMLIIADLIGIFLGALVMTQAWRAIMLDYSGWFGFIMRPSSYVKVFAFILIGYLIVVGFDFGRIRKIPLDRALKNVE